MNERSEAPSLQGFLSPGNGGNEGGVKTIEAGGEVTTTDSSI
jgi:hypothetical protein